MRPKPLQLLRLLWLKKSCLFCLIIRCFTSAQPPPFVSFFLSFCGNLRLSFFTNREQLVECLFFPHSSSLSLSLFLGCNDGKTYFSLELLSRIELLILAYPFRSSQALHLSPVCWYQLTPLCSLTSDDLCVFGCHHHPPPPCLFVLKSTLFSKRNKKTHIQDFLPPSLWLDKPLKSCSSLRSAPLTLPPLPSHFLCSLLFHLAPLPPPPPPLSPYHPSPLPPSSPAPLRWWVSASRRTASVPWAAPCSYVLLTQPSFRPTRLASWTRSRCLG